MKHAPNHLETGGEPAVSAIDRLLADLARSGWTGEIATDIGTRIVQSTDNSLYQLRPTAVVFPRTGDDIRLVAELAARHRVAVSARGGGTGTNGQSLTESVILDASKHMNRIVAFDPDTETVLVEPGVVLDQLNAYLAPFGYFFPPAVSTATRATVGGMVATDASGQGSRHYGKTSDYIVAMDVVLAGGEAFQVRDLDAHEAREIASRDDQIGRIHRTVLDEIAPRRDLIDDVFPSMNRGLTGYNLRDAVGADGSMRLAKLLSGSEGTLAWTTALTLKVKRKPKRSALVIVAYDDFQVALGDVPRMVDADPLAVEIIDDKILTLAKSTPVWTTLKETLGDIDAKALLFVEFTGETDDEVASKVAGLTAILERGPKLEIAAKVATDPAAIAGIWAMRRDSVGLLGALDGKRRASAFVEDCAVPPEKLTTFVAGFRQILDNHGLDYGMFGHADVGCLHVRPTVDMTEPADRQLIREISDAVAELAKENGGLLWGEHGRGVRAEYSPFFFGEELYGVLGRIKAAFDPDNVFNPRKLAVPEGMEESILKIDEVPFRGAADQEIDRAYLVDFDKAVACNGNAACHSWDALDAMCPSYKATRDRVQSPKGRAALVREWTRLSSTGEDPGALATVEAALAGSLETCLSCKACTSQCPIKVDIPSMKSAFLDRYFRHHARPLRDRVVQHMEPLTLALRRVPALANLAIGNPVSAAIADRAFAMVDLPQISGTPVETGFRARDIPTIAPGEALPAGDGRPSVLLLPDSFTGTFDTEVLFAAADVLTAFGYRVVAAPVRENGKGLHVRGFRDAFGKVRDQRVDELTALSRLGLPMIGVEPVATLLHRAEYAAEGRVPYEVLSIDSFLAEAVASGRPLPTTSRRAAFRLMAHCSEKTADPAVAPRWRRVFQALGQELTPARSGCCGMAGLFGHEAEHRALSERLYDLSWRETVETGDTEVLATGYSCRSQAKRFSNRRLRHPVEALADQLHA
ncbi:FAD-binding and (Fe-S)-binding domain-containing protein [Amorphus sp. 3PC139-8]|uniref:FAD-binding and (Fe-S)-binding domain-containing protein n=1 Tax=Amorphus sp. 3PC139-8 TaxID=2735676 RepID=UPI00345CF6D4